MLSEKKKKRIYFSVRTGINDFSFLSPARIHLSISRRLMFILHVIKTMAHNLQGRNNTEANV